MSIRPSRSSCSSWLENAPLPPLTSLSVLLRFRSPSVITTRFLNFTTGHGPPHWCRYSVTSAGAGRLPRAPTTTVSTLEGYWVTPRVLVSVRRSMPRLPGPARAPLRPVLLRRSAGVEGAHDVLYGRF